MSSSSYRQKGIQVAMDMIYGASLRKLSLFPKETGRFTVEEYNRFMKEAAQREDDKRDRDEGCWNAEQEEKERLEGYLGILMNYSQAREFSAGFYSVVDAVLKE